MGRNRAFEYDTSKYPNWIDPKDVTPYPRNAKKHPPEQVATIVNSITRFGWQQDVVLDKNNVCVIGHGRRLAAIEIGCKMPYHRIDKEADELTEAEIRALRIADNKVAESETDMDLLLGELDELEALAEDLDMADFGFEDVGGASDAGFTDQFTLKDGDREPVTEMTFTLSDGEAEVIKGAIAAMKGTQRFKDYDNPENKNGNGNALFLVVDEWQQQRI